METLELQHFDSEKTTSVQVLSRKPMDEISAEERQRLIVQFGISEIRRFSLVQKKPKFFLDKNEFERIGGSALYYSIWLRLKEAGIPVVPSIRRVSEETLVMTDLATKGAKVYSRHDYYGIMYNMRKSHALDSCFATFDLQQVEKEATQIGRIATAANISLASDDPLSLLMQMDRSNRLLALDISQMRFDDDLSSVERYNADAIKKFMNDLGFIQNYLFDKIPEARAKLRKETS